jgi:hypothetical protein
LKLHIAIAPLAQAKTISLQLKLKAFGLKGAALLAQNALTQVPIAMAQDGKLNVLVRAKSFLLVPSSRTLAILPALLRVDYRTRFRQVLLLLSLFI